MTAGVHPTAIIGEQVTLEDDVEIGAYSVIQDRVRIGRGSRVQHHVSIGGTTTIGRDNHFFPFAAIGHVSQDLRARADPDARLEIGDANTFRESTTINLGCHDRRLTKIGDNNMFMACAHVAHDCRIGNNVVIANSVLLAGHVGIDDNAVIGGGSAVHQFTRIGQYCMIGGCSRVIHDIPPFVMANGNPLYATYINRVGLKRAGFSSERIDVILELFRIFFDGNLSRNQRMDELSSLAANGSEERLFFNFVSAESQRPFVRRKPTTTRQKN